MNLMLGFVLSLNKCRQKGLRQKATVMSALRKGSKGLLDDTFSIVRQKRRITTMFVAKTSISEYKCESLLVTGKKVKEKNVPEGKERTQAKECDGQWGEE